MAFRRPIYWRTAIHRRLRRPMNWRSANILCAYGWLRNVPFHGIFVEYLHYEWHYTREKIIVAELYPTDRAALERDCDVEFFIASGPGGQHRNKVETGVRLVHRPSGIMVTATERRSQHANREAAFERMEARLLDLQRVVPPRRATRPRAGSRLRRLEAKRQ